MALSTTTIELGQTGPAPLNYTLKQAQGLAPQSISATFDGSGAAGPFLACCTFLAQDGKVIARCPIDSAMLAGDSAEVTFAPFLRSAGTGAAASGIQYDVDNTGTWLTVITTGFEPIVGNGIFWHATGDGNPIQVTSEGGINLNDVNGWGIVIDSTNGTGGSADVTFGVGRDYVVTAGRDIDMTAANVANYGGGTVVVSQSAGGTPLHIDSSDGITLTLGPSGTVQLFVHGTVGDLIVLDPTVLPAANPGVAGALWNNAGVLHVS
jgi:hypothetical protein